MVHCDECGTDVPEVWRHRERTESMTHHRIRWICRACHSGVHRHTRRITSEQRVVTGADHEVPAD